MNTSRIINRVIRRGVTRKDFEGPDGEIILQLGVNREVMDIIYGVLKPLTKNQLLGILDAHWFDQVDEDAHNAIEDDLQLNYIGEHITEGMQVSEGVMVLIATIVFNRVFDRLTSH